MKKLFLLLIVIFATASGSFAWTGSQSLSAWGYSSTGPYPGQNDYQWIPVNINSYCYNVEFTGSVNTDWAPSGPETSSAAAWIWDNDKNEISFIYAYPYVDTTKSFYYGDSSSYWGSVNVSVEAYLASISVTLRWDAM